MHTQITILIDNSPSKYDKSLKIEHGLSMWIEHEGSKILYDTGRSKGFIDNSKSLNIDLHSADHVVLSHGHNDHTGGVSDLLCLPDISSAAFHFSSRIMNHEYFSSRNNIFRDLTSPALDKLQNLQNAHKLDRSCWIESNKIALIVNTENHYTKPKGNTYLHSIDSFSSDSKPKCDCFDHEINIALVTPKGLIIISPCSHNGAANIIESSIKFTHCNRVHAYIGGLHFIDDPSIDTITEVSQFTHDLNLIAPHCQIHTGHCTGKIASENLIKTHNNVHFFHSGAILKF